MSKSYIFTLRRIPDQNNFLKCTMQLDSFLEIINQGQLNYDLLIEDMTRINAFSSIISAIKLRNHFNADILPKILKVDFSGDDLDREDFQMHIDALDEVQLNNFIEKATIYRKGYLL